MYRLVNETEGLSCKLPKGAFYIMANIEQIIGRTVAGRLIDGSTSFAEHLLNEKRVAVVPALAFGDDHYIRLSYAVSRQNIVEGMTRIRDFLAS